MPKYAVLNWQDDFVFLYNELKKMGWEFLSEREFKKTFERLDLHAPRPVFGREEGCTITRNGLTGFMWTTAVQRTKEFREAGTDAGRAGIKVGDLIVYMAKDLPRTKGFILRFLRYAWVIKWKIENRPLCPHCKAYMNIFQKRTTRQTMWVCTNWDKHLTKEYVYQGWDMNIGPKAKEFLAIRRKAYQKYKDALKKEGKEITPRKKKPWVAGRPENKTIVVIQGSKKL